MDFKMNEIVVVTKERIPLYDHFRNYDRARNIPTGLITRIVEAAFTLPYSDCFIRGLGGDVLYPFSTSYLRKANRQERFIYEMNNGPIRAE